MRYRHLSPFAITTASVLICSRLSFYRSHAAAFQNQQHYRHRRTRHVPRPPPPSSSSSSELEVEKKFRIADELSATRVEGTLASLGFDRVGREEEFVDWYFDLPAPHWHFSLRDVWIRYREKKIDIAGGWGWRGAWQVKRGIRKRDDSGLQGSDGDGITVYKELQGRDAKALILDMLSESESMEALVLALGKDSSPSLSPLPCLQYGEYDVPYLAGTERLVPFARLLTIRTCYLDTTNEGEFYNLKVDIDRTDAGYMVGEVEAVFNDSSVDQSEIEVAKENISKLVDLLSGNDDGDGSPIGKLEYYMIKYQRDHYDACVKSSVIIN
jgi:hypothetical protein